MICIVSIAKNRLNYHKDSIFNAFPRNITEFYFCKKKLLVFITTYDVRIVRLEKDFKKYKIT